MRITGNRIANIILLLAAAVVLSFVAYSFRTGRFRLDDSFMFLRYAHNLAEHGTFGWNAGERAYGCTSIPYTLFVLLVKSMNTMIGSAFSNSSILLMSSLAWGCAALLLLYRTLGRIAGEGGILDPVGIKLIIASVLVSPMFFVSLVTGMDASLSLFSNILLVYLMLSYANDRSRRLLILSVLGAYLTFLVRPDNGFYALLFPGLFMMWQGFPARAIFRFYILLGALMSLDLAIKYLYFGSPIPLSYYAKAHGLYRNYLEFKTWNPFTYLFLFLLTTGAMPVMAVLRFNREVLRIFIAFLLPMALTFLVFFKTVQIMGFFARYYAPSIPFMICAGAFALRGQRELTVQKEGVRNIVIVAISLIALNTAAFIYDRQVARYDSGNLRKIESIYYSSSYDCRSTRRDGDIVTFSRLLYAFPFVRTVALSEHGFISAEHPELYITDLVGLHNPGIATRGLDEDVFTDPEPEIIWLHWAYGWLNLEMRKLDAWQRYLYLPVFNGGIAIRKDSLLLSPGNREKLMDMLDCREISTGLSAPAFYR